MKKQYLQLLLCAGLFLLHVLPSQSQGWRKEYGGPPVINDYGYTLLATPDNGFILDGGARQMKTDADGNLQWANDPEPNGNFRLGNRHAVLLADGSYTTVRILPTDSIPRLSKYDASGALLWVQEYAVLTGEFPYVASIDETADGGFVFLVNESYLAPICDCTRFRYHVVKTDSLGAFVWQVTNEGPIHYLASSVKTLSDGGIVIAGSHHNAGTTYDAYIEKRDANGNQLWEKEWPLPNNENLVSVIETADGHIVAMGERTIGNFKYILLVKLDQDGDEVWFQDISGLDNPIPYDIKETAGGNLIVVGSLPDGPTGFILHFDANGAENWRRIYDNDNYTEVFYSVQPCPDGGFAISGSNVATNDGKFLLLKTDSLGYVHTYTLFGKIFIDQALDCALDGGETGLQNWIVVAAGAETFYGSADADGHFSMLVDTGSYVVNVSLPSGAWALCQPGYPVQSASVYDSTQVDIPVQPLFDCPAMEVSLSTPFIRPCFQSFYNVYYCNNGTIPAQDATLEVLLAPELAFESTTGALISQNGQLLTFDLGDVGVNECGSFSIQFNTECDLDLIGQTLCSEAHIFPDTLCGEMYQGPIIEASGQCENDTVRFELLNSGDGMPDIHEYIIIEDNIILMQGDFQLGPDESLQTAVAAASGATYHILAAQAPGYPPALGNHVASFSIEGCVGDPNPGIFNQLLSDDGEPWFDIECREATAAYDPNDKTPSPTGWTEQHFIDNRTELEYRIRFQNTGNDTAFTVILVDTLSALLDPASIRPGASSHPYTFELSGQGVARFTFPNIMLPDSATNEAASQGFAQFRIAQKPGNPIGAVIENTAHIYFDFNAPIATNTTWHTIGAPWVSVISGTVHTSRPGLKATVFPNPFDDSATFRLEGYDQGGILELYDAHGRLLLTQTFTAGETRIQRNALPPGLYFFQMRNENALLGAGRIICR